jgi:hypothetical protein
MDISARSCLTAGISLSAATAIAFAPLAAPPSHHTDIRLAATPAEVVALPGQALIGVVDNIVTLIDVVFTGAIDATDDPTIAASLSMLETLSSDAFSKLAENLGLANDVITNTTREVGALLTTAVTGSGQLRPENILRAVRVLGAAAFELAEIAVSEVTFQIHNLATGIGALVTQVGQAPSAQRDDEPVAQERVAEDEEANDDVNEGVSESVREELAIEEVVEEDAEIEDTETLDAAVEEVAVEESEAEESAPVESAPEESATQDDAPNESSADETEVSPAASE